jgi:hypothetical protein
MKDYYKILIVGQSGKGKTYSARNLNPLSTGFLNVENKPLPFKNKFKFHERCENLLDVKMKLKAMAENEHIKTIFIDSFSAFVELLLSEARKTKRGFDIWNYYNEEIGKMLNYIKSIQKEVIMTAHYEMLNIEGDPEKRVKVKGKEWEGLIEKEFTMVLYADRAHDEKGKVKAWFNTSQEGTSSKCPPDIFGESVEKIENDCEYVIDKTVEFARGE